jgi:hypothetical protein
MVVVRIKNDGKNQVPKKINNDDIKIISSLTLCKIINDDEYEKVEKKIEFITYDGNKEDNEKTINASVFDDFNQFRERRSNYHLVSSNNNGRIYNY